MKPSMDQVLTNCPTSFGVACTCVSRSAMCTAFTPSDWASSAHPSWLAGVAASPVRNSSSSAFGVSVRWR